MQVETARQLSGETLLSVKTLRSIRLTVTLAASLGWFFDAYVITIYALTVPLIAAEFHLATNILSGAIGSIFLFPYVTEVWGRNNRSIGIGIMFAFYPLGYLFSILVFRLV